MADEPESRAEAAPQSERLPLFDARYRWVLLPALRWLRDETNVALDLDEQDQLQVAYDLLSRVVQEHVRERGLAETLDASRVAAIAESRVVRATVLEILRREHPDTRGDGTKGWDTFVRRPAVREMIAQGAHREDPSLDPDELDRRARDRRTEFARSFGLHARITEVELSAEGGLRVHVAFDEDIAFVPDDLKALEINGVLLSGAQLVDVQRDEVSSPKVRAVIAVNVDQGSIASLKARPMRVTATTQNDVRVQAVKLV